LIIVSSPVRLSVMIYFPQCSSPFWFSSFLVDHLNRIFTLRRKSTLEKTGITHIVSVLKYDFKDFEDWEKYDHLNIEVDDVDDENLLGEFEKTGKWVEEGLKNGKDGKKGGVLVHW
jgi:dual specificity phosphatase 12